MTDEQKNNVENFQVRIIETVDIYEEEKSIYEGKPETISIVKITS